MPILGSLAANPLAGFYNVKDYGAVGDYTHDDTANIQAAINAIKAAVLSASGYSGGNVLYFPPGFYKTTARLNFTGMGELHVLGYSGRGGQRMPTNPATCIAYTGGGSGVAFDLGASQACVWDGVSLWATTSSFSGTLLSLDTAIASDIFGHRVQNCQLRAVSGVAGAVLLSMAGNIEVSIDNVAFLDAPSGVQVKMVNPSAPARWSNANSFRSCSFIGDRATTILNPGPQTTLVDCTFEPNTAGLPAPILYNALGNEKASGLTLVGCGFWDNIGTGGSWIKSTVATDAFAIIGGKYGAGPGGNIFSLASHKGLAISGVRFDAVNGGTPNVFDPAFTITNGSMLGCNVEAPVVDNHTSVFV